MCSLGLILRRGAAAAFAAHPSSDEGSLQHPTGLTGFGDLSHQLRIGTILIAIESDLHLA